MKQKQSCLISILAIEIIKVAGFEPTSLLLYHISYTLDKIMEEGKGFEPLHLYRFAGFLDQCITTLPTLQDKPTAGLEPATEPYKGPVIPA